MLSKRQQAKIQSTIRLCQWLGIKVRFNNEATHRSPTPADLIDPIYLAKFRRQMRAGFVDLYEMKISIFLSMHDRY